MGNLIYIGDFKNDENDRYECYFDPQQKRAHALGPVPYGEKAVGIAYETPAENEVSARNRLQVLMAPGRFIGS